MYQVPVLVRPAAGLADSDRGEEMPAGGAVHGAGKARHHPVKLLQQTLDEERAADSALTKLATKIVNIDAEAAEAAK
jgi:hypothetical protein